MSAPKLGAAMSYTGCPECEMPNQFGELCERCIGYNDPSCLDSNEDFEGDL